ncbi:MAG: enoyl-CoA hydratase-related protein [Actinomycetes bacterium]|nr:MAG: enoyl-CoA hydratase [Actinomycetota bacterium]
MTSFAHIEIEHDGPLATIWLNRPDKLNAMSKDMWADLPAAVEAVEEERSARVVIVAGRGTAFTAGIDVGFLASLSPQGPSPAANARAIHEAVLRLQGTFNRIAESPLPFIAAIHGYCLGAGMSLITACDLRVASRDAIFSIRETKMGLTADVGVLQRLPSIVGDAVTAEMAFTGDDYDAGWAHRNGLVSSVHGSPEATLAAARDLAGRIAVNSPLVLEGVKRIIQSNRGRTLADALEYMAQWNSARLVSNDMAEALNAFFSKRPPDYTGT